MPQVGIKWNLSYLPQSKKKNKFDNLNPYKKIKVSVFKVYDATPKCTP